MKNSFNLQPLVSVGIPVFNGADSIAKAIESVLSQSYKNIEIIISDNASTDQTNEIASRYAASDQRISVHANSKNLGAVLNFEKTLRLASGELFIWLAADDFWSGEFLSASVAKLRLDSTLTSVAIEPLVYVDGRQVVDKSFKEYTSNSWRIRQYQYLRSPSKNSIFYSLFRRSALANLNFSEINVLGFDLIITLQILRHGKLQVTSEAKLIRPTLGESSNFGKLRRSHKASFLFPYARMAFKVFGKSWVLHLVVPMVKINLLAMLHELRESCSVRR